MGARTIDEGIMDYPGIMNYSEYVAILSGNTDLLDKSKSEKIMQDLIGNQDKIDRLGKDLQNLNSQVKCDEAGAVLNPTFLDGVLSDDIKVFAHKLVEIEDKPRTHSVPTKIGTL